MATNKQIGLVKRDAVGIASLLSDPDIGDLIDEEDGIHERVVARCYDMLAAKATEKGEIHVGKYSESFMLQAKNYQLLAKFWRGRIVSGTPFAGGISKADVEARKADSDRVVPTFDKGSDANNEG